MSRHLDWNAGTDAPAGIWLVAGTSADEVYPCRCKWSKPNCSPKFCPCSGRTDYVTMELTCCAWQNNTPAVAAAAQAQR